MNIMNLLSIGYWTDLRPRYFTAGTRSFIIAILVALVVLSIVTLIMKRRGGFYKKVFSRLYSFFLANFIVAGFLFFFRFELVPFLSARFWAGIWIIASIIWAISIIKEARRVPEKIKASELDREKSKYIPKP